MRIFLLSIVLVITACSKNVDLILHNGVVYSGGQQLNKSSAFAVKDGVFIAVSEDDNDILKNYSSDNVINAQGLPVYPGFIELDDIQIPDSIKGRFQGFGENIFRKDVSSSVIRAQSSED